MHSGSSHRSKDDAGRLVRQCSQDGGLVATRHFLCELEKEGLSIVDAVLIIGRGYVFDEPEHDVSSGKWKYLIKGTAPEGQFINIVFCFNSDDEAVLITVFSD